MPDQHRIEIDRHYRRDRLMDIIGHPPGWLLHSGIGLLAVMALLLGCVAWYVRYPDVMEAPVVITRSRQPVEAYSRSSAIIDSIYVLDGAHVTEGQILLYMHNTARLSDVMRWVDWLYVLMGSPAADSLIEAPPVGLQLGELHPGYLDISQKHQEWVRWLADQRAAEKIRAFKVEGETIDKLVASLERQVVIYDQELTYHRSGLEREESLFRSGVIAALDREKATTSYLALTRQREALAAGIHSHRLRRDQLESLILDARIGYENEMHRLHTQVRDLCRASLAAFRDWEEEYVVRARIPGTISMPTDLLPYTLVPASQPLLAVIPDVDGLQSVAVASVAASGLGKIEPGNRVLIRLDAWPYKEYGSLAAEVTQIAELPRVGGDRRDTFEVRMPIAAPILTTTGDSLFLKPRETGVARIITRERRLLARLFDQVLSLIHSNSRSA